MERKNKSITLILCPLANIKKICRRIVESSDETERDKNSDALQELVTYVQYANDESDYGMGLELGLDLLAFGGEEFHSTILHLLGVAYELLERQEFLTILKVTNYIYINRESMCRLTFYSLFLVLGTFKGKAQTRSLRHGLTENKHLLC